VTRALEIRRSALRGCAAAALVLLTVPVPGKAQEVVFHPRRSSTVDTRLSEFLARASRVTWVRDTIIPADGAVRGNLLVLSAQVRLSGSVDGDIYVVDGDLFLRPGATVSGDVVVLGGGYYGSGMATVAGEVVWKPAERYSVVPNEGGYDIRPVEKLPPPVDLHGLYGFEAPTYQRVDALTVAWGITLRANRWAWRPSLELVARYRSGQGEFEGTVKQFWHPGSVEFGLEASRATRTQEGWIRAPVSNSLSFLFLGDDFRNYYGADRAALVVRGSGDRWWTPELRVEWEDAWSRFAGDPFTFLGPDGVRPNPAIDDGEDWSATLSLAVDRKTGRSGRLAGRAVLQAADSSVAGDFSYLLGEIQARWKTPGFASHEVDLFALIRGDLSGTLPGQRWTGFGGRATLPTFDIMEFRGPRVAYGQVGYAIPIDALEAGGLGAPAVFGRVGGGTVWAPGQSADWKVNLVAGLRFWVVEGGVAFDPAADGDVKAYAIFRFPGDL
jgi:hypothetical protein